MARALPFRRSQFFRAVLIVSFGFFVAASAPSHAQDTDHGATGGAPTLQDILERQNLLKRGIDDVTSQVKPAPAASAAPPDTLPGALDTRGPQSDSDIWRALKGGAEATPSSSTATGQLIQMLGEDWRLVRREVVLKYSGWVLLGVITLIALFFLIRGRIRIRGGRSGKTIPRFSMSHRIAHWFLASTFILMAITGLIILLGRPVLAPLIGKPANAVLASASLQGHNLLGPVFILALLILTFRFMRGNFFQWADFKWIIKGGGLLGGHASSNHYNFGEKTWYWLVVLVGLGMSITGMFLLFPWLSDTLGFHQAATILHAVGAVLLIAVAMGHAYIGSIGMEGSLDSMLRGEVDENWAREHHDLWYEKVTGKSVDHDDDGSPGAATEGTA